MVLMTPSLFTSSKSAFTLAEVLITLGIIGVVAAMTLPTVVSNYRHKEATARLKKFYSTMQQAIIYAENDFGEMKNWEVDSNNETSNVDRAEKYYRTYLDNNYFKTISVERKYVPNSNRETLALTFADGTILYLWNGTCVDLLFDINGDKKPNKDGRDIFKFLHCKNGRLKPYNIQGGDVSTREKALAACKKYPTECMPLIMIYDNFEFRDDYPYRL